MNSKDIKNLVLAEIKNSTNRVNLHGINLNKCDIEPVLQTYESVLNKSITLELWTVLEETPDGKGYKIVYCPEKKEFGLGIGSAETKLYFLACNGSFMDTFYAM